MASLTAVATLDDIDPVVESVSWELERWSGLRLLAISLEDVTELGGKLLLALLVFFSRAEKEEGTWELVGRMTVLFLLGILPLDGIELALLPTSKTSSTRLAPDDLTECGPFLLEVNERMDLYVVVVLPD